jgi:hypothetical protein
LVSSAGALAELPESIELEVESVAKSVIGYMSVVPVTSVPPMPGDCVSAASVDGVSTASVDGVSTVPVECDLTVSLLCAAASTVGSPGSRPEPRVLVGRSVVDADSV